MKDNRIRRIAVLGAGTMGARIAAHIANAGYNVLLLDRRLNDANTPDLASDAIRTLRKSRPAAAYLPSILDRIELGTFEDDLSLIRDCDWIIEAVAEDISIKRDLLQRVQTHRRPHVPVTTNTSGLSVAEIALGFPDEFRAHWLGLHFFNPPRYMNLVEIISTADTKPEIATQMESFCVIALGKTCVHAKDTPNFIANRVGIFNLVHAMQLGLKMGLDVEEVDHLTGPLLGWPRSGTFHLADLIGLDVLDKICRNFSTNTSTNYGTLETLQLPPVCQKMLDMGFLGEKSGKGFYRQGAAGREVLNLQTFEYVRCHTEGNVHAYPSDLRARLRWLIDTDINSPEYVYLWRLLSELWIFCAKHLTLIAENVHDVDCAMRSGFNWELGPFEMWDVVGVEETYKRMHCQGRGDPSVIETLISTSSASSEPASWYRIDEDHKRKAFNGRGTHSPLPDSRERMQLESLCKMAVVSTSEISLIDLGEGIGCLTFHSKMNALSDAMLEFIIQVLGGDAKESHRFRAFVIANDGKTAFSVGANLSELLNKIENADFAWIERFIEHFQRMCSAIRFCSKPVVVAPFGLTLGGGAEVVFHAPVIRAYTELHIGLVETNVGLIPAGGGCRMAVVEAARQSREKEWGCRSGEYLYKRFEQIAKGIKSTSAVEALSIGMLPDGTRLTMNRSRLLWDARSEAIAQAATSYMIPTQVEPLPSPGREELANIEQMIWLWREAEYISAYDVKVYSKLARVLCGGGRPQGSRIKEQDILDLEREVFMALSGEPQTAARIRYTLQTGKSLKN